MTELPALGERLLRLRDVKVKTSLGTTTIYRMMADGEFPQPLRLGTGTVRWRESKIDQWISELEAKSLPAVATVAPAAAQIPARRREAARP